MNIEEAVDCLRRYVLNQEDAQAHMQKYPEFWGENPADNCGSGTEADLAWSAISGRSVGHDRMLDACRVVIASSDTSRVDQENK